MIWNAARGGMRSVVEAYQRDGFVEAENVTLIHSYTDAGTIARQILLLRALASYIWTLATKRVDLVHIHAAMRGSFWRKGLFSSLARMFKVPVILHLHGSEMKLFYGSQRPAVQKMIRGHLEKADRVVVLSQSWKDFVSSIAPAARISVVPNYVTLPDLPGQAAQNPRDILFLGLIGPRKGTFDLIESFASIVPNHEGARLIIGGNGQVDEAAVLIRERGLDGHAVLAGWVDGAKKTELLATSGIYALPSYNEGLPMSVLEAMAAGLAVVTTRVGGIPELVTDGVDGILLEPGDRVGLSRALDALLGDDKMRRRIAEAGRARIEAQYSNHVVLPMLHTIYAEVARPAH
ncbi:MULTISPECIES: glycosyltransferase family 4 protein [unclassified Aureimonas]|uniref:glycosyltransferase family 4 protein n=1 Tax=unclassified Aureimonas TaxID=2615206 RepID=UPI001FCD358B|nr:MULTISPECIES: glycosyltransferase family 4 protein [unclassified Aureimonas]